MIPRRLLPALTTALAEVPAVALLGPRQVGKTTLALAVASSRPSVCLDLESETGWAKLTEHERYLAQRKADLTIWAPEVGHDESDVPFFVSAACMHAAFRMCPPPTQTDAVRARRLG